MAYYALILTWFLEYVRPGTDVPLVAAFKIYTIVPLATFLLAVASNSKNTHKEIASSPAFWLLLFFMLWIVLSAIVAIDTSVTFTRLNQVFGYTLMFYSIARVADTYTRVRGLMAVLLLMHVLLIALNPALITDPDVRSYLNDVTFLGDGNDFALSACFVFPMGLLLFRTTSSKLAKIVFGSCTVILALSIIGTQSRGGSLALGMSLLYLWWHSRNRVQGGIAVAALVIAALLFAGPSYFSRMSTLADVHADGSAQGRLDAWSNAMYIGAGRSPLLGTGAGNFPLHNKGLTAHSIYFLALGELGIPGMLFALLCFIIPFRRNSKLLRESEHDPPASFERLLLLHINASILGLATAGAFLSALYYPHIFVMGALTTACVLIVNRNHGMTEKADSAGPILASTRM